MASQRLSRPEVLAVMRNTIFDAFRDDSAQGYDSRGVRDLGQQLRNTNPALFQNLREEVMAYIEEKAQLLYASAPDRSELRLQAMRAMVSAVMILDSAQCSNLLQGPQALERTVGCLLDLGIEPEALTLACQWIKDIGFDVAPVQPVVAPARSSSPSPSPSRQPPAPRRRAPPRPRNVQANSAASQSPLVLPDGIPQPPPNEPPLMWLIDRHRAKETLQRTPGDHKTAMNAEENAIDQVSFGVAEDVARMLGRIHGYASQNFRPMQIQDRIAAIGKALAVGEKLFSRVQRLGPNPSADEVKSLHKYYDDIVRPANIYADPVIDLLIDAVQANTPIATAYRPLLPQLNALKESLYEKSAAAYQQLFTLAPADQATLRRSVQGYIYGRARVPGHPDPDSEIWRELFTQKMQRVLLNAGVESNVAAVLFDILDAIRAFENQNQHQPQSQRVPPDSATYDQLREQYARNVALFRAWTEPEYLARIPPEFKSPFLLLLHEVKIMMDRLWNYQEDQYMRIHAQTERERRAAAAISAPLSEEGDLAEQINRLNERIGFVNEAKMDDETRRNTIAPYRQRLIDLMQQQAAGQVERSRALAQEEEVNRQRNAQRTGPQCTPDSQDLIMMEDLEIKGEGVINIVTDLQRPDMRSCYIPDQLKELFRIQAKFIYRQGRAPVDAERRAIPPVDSVVLLPPGNQRIIGNGERLLFGLSKSYPDQPAITDFLLVPVGTFFVVNAAQFNGQDHIVNDIIPLAWQNEYNYNTFPFLQRCLSQALQKPPIPGDLGNLPPTISVGYEYEEEKVEDLVKYGKFRWTVYRYILPRYYMPAQDIYQHFQMLHPMCQILQGATTAQDLQPFWQLEEEFWRQMNFTPLDLLQLFNAVIGYAPANQWNVLQNRFHADLEVMNLPTLGSTLLAGMS